MLRLEQDRNRLTVIADHYDGLSSARGMADAFLAIPAKYQSSSSAACAKYHNCQKPYVSWHQFANKIVTKA